MYWPFTVQFQSVAWLEQVKLHVHPKDIIEQKLVILKLRYAMYCRIIKLVHSGYPLSIFSYILVAHTEVPHKKFLKGVILIKCCPRDHKTTLPFLIWITCGFINFLMLFRVWNRTNNFLSTVLYVNNSVLQVNN